MGLENAKVRRGELSPQQLSKVSLQVASPHGGPLQGAALLLSQLHSPQSSCRRALNTGVPVTPETVSSLITQDFSNLNACVNHLDN